MVNRGDTPFERSIQAATIKRLNRDPRTLVRCRAADSAGHVVGDPDIYGSIGGTHVEIEVKTSTGVPSKIQWYQLRSWAARGAACAVTTTADEAIAFQQEVLAGKNKGYILVFGKALEQVRQGTHGAGPEVAFATIGSRSVYEVPV